MDILDFSEEIKNFRHNGLTLNLDERMQLEGALNQLQCKCDDEELAFWGKIQGVKNDYFIAIGTTYTDMYEFPVKRFYWALSSDLSFKELPALTEHYNEVINKHHSFFQGDPALVIVSVKKEDDEGNENQEGQEEGQEEEEEKKQENSDHSEEEEVKVPKRDLTGKFQNRYLNLFEQKLIDLAL